MGYAAPAVFMWSDALKRTGRLLAVGLTNAWLCCLAQPAFAQQALAQQRFAQAADDDAPDTGSPEAAKPAPGKKPTPRASTPAKPPVAAKSAAPAASGAPAASAFGASSQPAAPSKPPITAQDVRPPAAMMVDCAAAPKDAVTKLPDELARWATVYCTRLGHIFNANDQYFGAFPDDGLRASFNAADMSAKEGAKLGEPGNDAYFTAIGYRPLTAAERNALIATDPSVQRIYEGKALWRLDLTAVGGATLSFLAIEPAGVPFWVFPLGPQGIGKPAFYVTSLDAVNKAR